MTTQGELVQRYRSPKPVQETGLDSDSRACKGLYPVHFHLGKCIHRGACNNQSEAQHISHEFQAVVHGLHGSQLPNR